MILFTVFVKGERWMMTSCSYGLVPFVLVFKNMIKGSDHFWKHVSLVIVESPSSLLIFDEMFYHQISSYLELPDPRIQCDCLNFRKL